MYLVVILFEFISSEFLELLGCVFLITYFYQVGKTFSHHFQIFFLYTFLSLLLQGSPQSVCWSIWLCPTAPLDSLHFSSIFFLSLSQTQSFTLSYLHVYWFFSFAGSNLSLNPSNEFLISFIVLFSSRISFWSLSRFSYFLIDSSILLIHCFLDFLHIFLYFFEQFWTLCWSLCLFYLQ